MASCSTSSPSSATTTASRSVTSNARAAIATASVDSDTRQQQATPKRSSLQLSDFGSFIPFPIRWDLPNEWRKHFYVIPKNPTGKNTADMFVAKYDPEVFGVPFEYVVSKNRLPKDVDVFAPYRANVLVCPRYFKDAPNREVYLDDSAVGADAGIGVFAKRDIATGSIVCIYAGELVHKPDSATAFEVAASTGRDPVDVAKEWALQHDHTYDFDIPLSDLSIRGAPKALGPHGVGQLINDGCALHEPTADDVMEYLRKSNAAKNVAFVYESDGTWTPALATIRPIQAGEELFLSYGPKFWLKKAGHFGPEIDALAEAAEEVHHMCAAKKRTKKME